MKQQLEKEFEMDLGPSKHTWDEDCKKQIRRNTEVVLREVHREDVEQVQSLRCKDQKLFLGISL